MPHAARPTRSPRDGYISDSSSTEAKGPRTPRSKGHGSDLDVTLTKPSFFNLRESLASLSEPRLRALLVSLADNHPGLESLISQELKIQPKILSNSRTPEAKLRRERMRRGSSASRKGKKCLTCGVRPKVAATDKEASGCSERACRYHPGQTIDEVYEFLTRTPEGRSFTVLRTITSWSCCEQDAQSPGCAFAAAHTYRSS